jgi:hypothetical protein
LEDLRKLGQLMRRERPTIQVPMTKLVVLTKQEGQMRPVLVELKTKAQTMLVPMRPGPMRQD